MKLLPFLLFLIIGACQQVQPSTAKKTLKMNPEIIILQGDVPQQIGNDEVLFCNIMLQDYTLRDGSVKKGVAASLGLPNSKEWLTVGKGSSFKLDSISYEVLSIEYGDNDTSVSGGSENRITIRVIKD